MTFYVKFTNETPVAMLPADYMDLTLLFISNKFYIIPENLKVQQFLKLFKWLWLLTPIYTYNYMMY